MESYPAHPGHRFPEQQRSPTVMFASHDFHEGDLKERDLATSGSGSGESGTVVGKSDQDDE